MTVRFFVRLISLLVASLLLATIAVRDASAAPNDKEVEALIESVFSTDYLNAKFDDALKQLELGKQACEGKQCSPKVRAKLFVAIGTVLAGGLKKHAAAKEAFVTALKEDPTASLFTDVITPEVQKAFNEARGVATPSGGTPETNKGPGERKPKKTFPGGGRAPRGWRTAEGFFYWSEASKAEASRDWLDCADYAQASLAAENRAVTRLLAASCEERAGLWVEALADFQTVIDTAPKLGLHEAAKQAQARWQALRDKIPKIVIRKPAKADDLVVTMNDAEIPPDKLGGEIWVNPGQRTVRAKAKVDGVDLEFEQVIEATEFESSTIEIKLGPKGAKGDQVMMRCMMGARTRDDFAKCLNKGGPSFDVHLGAEFSAYHDSDHVDVVTPAFRMSLESPTGGWGVGASFLVDVVTAASSDIIATASPRWREVRWVPAINAHKKIGPADISVRGTHSHEPDYLASSGGVGFSIDLADKTVTPNLSYEISYDISGRAGTAYATFSREIVRHAINAGSTFVINKSTFLAASFSAVVESGDTSKPYRYIPMFSAKDAPNVPAGLSIDGVNKYRLPIRALEQLPTDRQRWAVAALIAHRFTSSTLRAAERLYIDSWGLKASTTDAQFLIDVHERVRLWPQVRVHAQTPVDFWQIAYVAKETGASFKLPALRTGDRELGPLIGLTFGGGFRFALGEKKNWGLSIMGDVVYTKFLQHLYLLERIGYFGATTLEVDLE